MTEMSRRKEKPSLQRQHHGNGSKLNAIHKQRDQHCERDRAAWQSRGLLRKALVLRVVTTKRLRENCD